MRRLRTLPALIAALLLAAHFFRSGAFALSAVCIGAAALAFVRRGWAVGISRLGLAAGSIVWARTAWRIARIRMEGGMPYLRMLVILGAVAAFTAFAAWILPGAPAPGDS